VDGRGDVATRDASQAASSHKSTPGDGTESCSQAEFLLGREGWPPTKHAQCKPTSRSFCVTTDSPAVSTVAHPSGGADGTHAGGHEARRVPHMRLARSIDGARWLGVRTNTSQAHTEFEVRFACHMFRRFEWVYEAFLRTGVAAAGTHYRGWLANAICTSNAAPRRSAGSSTKKRDAFCGRPAAVRRTS